MDVDCLVVGAGHAGLALAWHVVRDGRSCVVLERGRIGNTWRTQRWDSFRLNTPNALNLLPGMPAVTGDADAFATHHDWADALVRYAADHRLPVHEHTEVTSVAPAHGAGFLARARRADGSSLTVTARTVVIASGVLHVPRIPACAARLPSDIAGVHAADYRRAAALPEGAVAVVGGAQSGCQIAEDLLEAGRTVFLSTSRVPRVRRRYRGRDILRWWTDMGFFEVRPEDLEDPRMQFAAQPQVSGVGPRGRSVSYQSLARAGVTLLGHLQDVADGALVLAPDLGANIRYADERAALYRKAVDDYIAKAGVSAPPQEPDPADEAAPDLWTAEGPGRLDLRASGIGAVIWCTGFGADFRWLEVPVFDADGRPAHTHGRSPVPGLWFVGFPWLRRRGSGIIPGVGADAAHIAAEVRAHLAG